MNEIAIQAKDFFTNKDLTVLRSSKFKDFTDNEVAQCVQICSHLQLNPILNQIHFVKRAGTITPQVGIDGFRLTADRTGKYAGSDEAIFEYKEGDKLKKLPLKASVTVYKMISGVRCAFNASARWDEYYPGDKQGHMWQKMPHNQLAKCAEALALRKAFPAELSALRSDEEMMQTARDVTPSKADNLNSRGNAFKEPVEDVEVESPPSKLEPEQIKAAIQNRMTKVNWSNADLASYCQNSFSKHASTLNTDELNQVLEYLNEQS